MYIFVQQIWKCPKCGHTCSKAWVSPAKEVRCLEQVKRVGPRAKGETRMVDCGTVMLPVPGGWRSKGFSPAAAK